MFGCVTSQCPPTTGGTVCLALTHAQASRLACDAFQTTGGSNVRSGVCRKSLCPLSCPLFLLCNRRENTARPARYRVEQSWGGPVVLAEAALNQRTAGRPQPAADSRCLVSPAETQRATQPPYTTENNNKCHFKPLSLKVICANQ